MKAREFHEGQTATDAFVRGFERSASDPAPWLEELTCQREPSDSVKTLAGVAVHAEKGRNSRASQQEVLPDTHRTRRKKNESNGHLQVPRDKK